MKTIGDCREEVIDLSLAIYTRRRALPVEQRQFDCRNDFDAAIADARAFYKFLNGTWLKNADDLSLVQGIGVTEPLEDPT